MNKMLFLETIKIENGEVVNFDLHQERVIKTAYAHYGTRPWLSIDLSMMSDEWSSRRVKCRVLYGENIVSVEFCPYQPKVINSLQLVENNEINYAFKYADRECLNQLLEQKKGADDIIIVKNGMITDTSYSNLVFETVNGELVTPTTTLLEGTKRKMLLQRGVIAEREIAVEDLRYYQKVYLINAMLDLEDNISIPITSIKQG